MEAALEEAPVERVSVSTRENSEDSSRQAYSLRAYIEASLRAYIEASLRAIKAGL